ncbi:MAG: hypothetical protein LRZ98_01535 [Candidatus Pacebacteria bacterium]|nr:hypothetical protein [Candidatus Paceibacterota bacterium]
MQKILKTKKGQKIIKKVKKIIKKFSDEFKTSKKFQKISKKITNKIEKIENKIELSLDEHISYDDYKKLKLKIGVIKSAKKINKEKNFFSLLVNFEDKNNMRVVVELDESYTGKKLLKKQAIFITNIKPKVFFDINSQAIILGIRDDEKNFILLKPEKKVKSGQLII